MMKKVIVGTWLLGVCSGFLLRAEVFAGDAVGDLSGAAVEGVVVLGDVYASEGQGYGTTQEDIDVGDDASPDVPADAGEDARWHSVYIAEILANPEGVDRAHEFVELFNGGQEEVALGGWSLVDASGRSAYVFPAGSVIAPQAYHVLRRDADFTFALNNRDETLTLTRSAGDIVDAVSYASTEEGRSWNRDTDGEDVWYGGVPTPGAPNTPHPRTVAYPHLIITEIYPDPEGDEATQEFIELYNPGIEEVDLTDWTLRDASMTGRYTFPGDLSTTIAPGAYLAVSRTTYGFALNNTGEESVSLIAPNDTVIDTLSYDGAEEGHSLNRTHISVVEEGEAPATYVWSETRTPGAVNVWATPEDVVSLPLMITEILPNPVGDEVAGEFIELYNPHDTAITLTGWTLRDASTRSGHVFAEGVVIAPGAYLAVSRTTYGFALNNTGEETISLTMPGGSVASTLTYTGSTEGESYARTSLEVADESFAWTTTLTPGAVNVITVPEGAENAPDEKFIPEDSYPTILLSEILPNPVGDEATQEFIELYNPHENAVDLSQWVLADASQGGRYIFPADSVIASQSYFTIYRAAYGFALNNTDETIILTDPRGTLSDTYTYTETREGMAIARESMEKEALWRPTPHLTPGAVNVFEERLAITKLVCPEEAYRDVAAAYSVEATEGDVSVRWDFGDARRSYKQETTHLYTERDVYEVHVRVRGRVEDVTATCTTRVTRYPRDDVRIIAIAPNPTGSDKGVEYITIENREDHEVDLTGWSVATGRDIAHVINHLFRDQEVLEAGASMRVTYAESAIALRNTSGAVVLRRPDGSTASDVVYAYPGEAAVPDDVLYRRTSNGWVWDTSEEDLRIARERARDAARRAQIIQRARTNDAQRSRALRREKTLARLADAHWSERLSGTLETIAADSSQVIHRALVALHVPEVHLTIHDPEQMSLVQMTPDTLCDSLVMRAVFDGAHADTLCGMKREL